MPPWLLGILLFLLCLLFASLAFFLTPASTPVEFREVSSMEQSPDLPPPPSPITTPPSPPPSPPLGPTKTLILLQACFNVDMVENTIQNLCATTDLAHVYLVVIENPSSHTPAMQDMLRRYPIHQYILMNENFWGYPFLYPTCEGALDMYWPDVSHVCLTDADVILSPSGWLQECHDLLATYPQLGLVALDLDTSNLPLWHPDGHTWRLTPERTSAGFLRARTGVQLLCLPTTVFRHMMQCMYDQHMFFLDSRLYNLLDQQGWQYAVTEHARAYHAGWDIYTDIHEHGEASVYYPYQLFKDEHITHGSPPPYTGYAVIQL
jgi:hypothetical protein